MLDAAAPDHPPPQGISGTASELLPARVCAKDDFKQVTFFPSPYGNAPLPKKQVLKYKRADGVDLSANLYLPPGYKPEDGPLPTLMEAYPTEYKTKIRRRTNQRLAV